MKKIIIAIDSFKGCLTSAEAGKAAEKGIKSINPFCHTSVIPIADGGEGLLDVLITATKGKYITLSAHGPLMKMTKTHYGLSGNGRTAIIEMAAISGLPLVPMEQRNPMLTTTFGTGELIKDALNKGCRNFIIGIGGSATNDAGLGMLQALGFRFLDKSGHTLGTGGQIMEAVANIDTSGIHPALRETHFMVACDVANPFYGPDGAAYIFAQQKGADSNMVQRLDEGMQSLAEVIKKTTGKDITNYPGAGAAGGMGGGLLAFFNAELKPGTELLLKAIDFSEKIKGADLIITGEGKADQQTAMGKVPYGILKDVEYPSVSSSSLPLAVLKQADFNLLIANACRLWGKNDDINLKSIKEMLGDTPLSLYLNNADREVVESFTGELPPKTPLHSFVSRLSQLGLTAKKAAVK